MERTSPYPATLTIDVIDILFLFLVFTHEHSYFPEYVCNPSPFRDMQGWPHTSPSGVLPSIGQKLDCSHYKQSGTCYLKYGQLEGCSFSTVWSLSLQVLHHHITSSCFSSSVIDLSVHSRCLLSTLMYLALCKVHDLGQVTTLT